MSETAFYVTDSNGGVHAGPYDSPREALNDVPPPHGTEDGLWGARKLPTEEAHRRAL